MSAQRTTGWCPNRTHPPARSQVLHDRGPSPHARIVLAGDTGEALMHHERT
ncbi:hypothetical protein [Microbacterium sp. B35-04]|uniref:hypothetical protein n=1 Tax=Microbacterium sp. B35-04 TaxID=1961716 RepID=UPI0013D22ED7|nr:hypothetical protein [Microbacterium sp. B35-04]